MRFLDVLEYNSEYGGHWPRLSHSTNGGHLQVVPPSSAPQTGAPEEEECGTACANRTGDAGLVWHGSGGLLHLPPVPNQGPGEYCV